MAEERRLGRRAVIVGAGIAGCFCAGAISEFFDETLVIDLDSLPPNPEERRGTPQGSHIHAVLRSAIDIAAGYFPGFEAKLEAAGGTPLSWGYDLRYHDWGSWQPRRDLGVKVSSQSRALLEHVLRANAFSRSGVSVLEQARVTEFCLEGGRVTGIVARRRGGAEERLDCDLVVDASGRGSQLPAWLERNGFGTVDQTELGVDICYVSAYYTRTTKAGAPPFGYVLRGNAPSVRSGVLVPIEGDRWVLSLSGRFGDFPPRDEPGFLDYVRSLHVPAIYDTIVKEKPLTPFSAFHIPKIFWRRYEQMTGFPDRLIPVGDAVTVFNPVYGQGMCVAAQSSLALRQCLEETAREGRSLDGIGGRCMPRIAEKAGAAWNVSANVDLSYAKTTGQRPPDFADRLKVARGLRKLLETDAEVHRLFVGVVNMLEPASVLARADIQSRAKALSADQHAAA